MHLDWDHVHCGHGCSENRILVLAALGERVARTTSSVAKSVAPDRFAQLYGGRLRGGGKQGLGLSLKDVFGSESQSSSSNSCQVDPDRFSIGDEFSFVYFRDTIARECRSVKLKRKKSQVPS